MDGVNDSTVAHVNGTGAGAGVGGNVNGNAPPVKKRIKKATSNPFGTARKTGELTRPNGLPRPTPRPGTTARPGILKPATPATVHPDAVSGFSDPSNTAQNKQFTDYKLVVRKKDLLNGLRYHLMDLSAERVVDIRDAKQFSQPAHLHRRDPRVQTTNVVREETTEAKDGMNAEEREALKVKNEQRKKEREANLAQIAPTQQVRKQNTGKTKTKAVFRADLTEDDKRRIQTNYEEKLPWVLEDFDSKHTLIGQHQPAAQNRHVAFVYERGVDPSTGKFRLVPVEKVYEFKPKRKEVKITDVELAESIMKKKHVLPFFLEQQQRAKLIKAQREAEINATKLFTGESKTNKYAGRTGDEADWDNDSDGGLFADDEDGDVIRDVKDEDEALAEKRIREDQLKANFFELKEEHEYDEEEAEEEREEMARKENRGIRKLLERHEGNYNHASDSEYSDSDQEDEAERARLEAERNAKLEERLQGSNNLQLPSGATTPSGRREKSDLLSDREAGKVKRKRTGEPYLSEAGSGTDTSARNKKPKVRHPSSTAAPLSRAGTPSGQPQKRRGGAGSDTDTGAMSDATRRSKLKHGSRPGNPQSRAGSPGSVSGALPNRSGAASPPAATLSMPTPEEVRKVLLNALPQELTLIEFIKNMPHPRNGQKELIAVVKNVATLVERNGKKVLVLKDQPAE